MTAIQPVSLLSYLRNDRHLTAAKDGCSGQAACGACLVELNGKACLACSTPMSKVTDGDVVTLEGLPETLRRTLGMAFVNRGAVQCGFCTPGFLMRAKVLLQTNPNPTREEVVKAVRPHLCRCTGYVKLVDAILDAATLLPEGNIPEPDDNPRLGSGWPKYGGYERAVGTHPFVNDIDAPGMAHGAIVFSEHPRARVLAIHTDEAADMPGRRPHPDRRRHPWRACARPLRQGLARLYQGWRSHPLHRRRVGLRGRGNRGRSPQLRRPASRSIMRF